MRRRALLVGLTSGAGALAGCLSDGEGGSPDDPDSTGDPAADWGATSVTSEHFEASIERPDTDVPVEFSLSEPGSDGADGEDAIGRLTLTLGNASDETVSVATGAPEPFDVLLAGLVDSGARGLLWTDTYLESGHVSIHDGGFGVNDFEVLYELEPGAVRSETYELHRGGPHDELDDRWGFEPGEYVVTETFPVDVGDRDEDRLYPLRLRLSVSEA